MTEMTSFSINGGGSTTETPVEGQPLLTTDVLTSDGIRRSALTPTWASLKRDFYCKCICDPLIKLKYTVPISAVKLCLLCLAATIVLVCLTMLEIVGAHRQGELQHALKERLKHRNLSQEKANKHSKHPHPHAHAASHALRQYGHSFLSKLKIANIIEQSGNATNQDVNSNSTRAVNETSFAQNVLHNVGGDHVADTLLNHIETVSNVSKEIANHIKDALT